MQLSHVPRFQHFLALLIISTISSVLVQSDCRSWRKKTGRSLHRLSTTRWGARIAAVRIVVTLLPSIIEALECILATCNLTSEAKSEANVLNNYFKTFDAVVLLTVWVKVLQCIGNRNLILQAGDISLDIETANMKALQDEIKTTCRALTRKYHKDLTVEFENKTLRLRTIYSATFPRTLSLLELLNAIYQMKLQSILEKFVLA